MPPENFAVDKYIHHVVGYQIHTHIQKSVAFLYRDIEYTVKEARETVISTIA